MDTREETACPACSEMILATAKKCKHCGEWVSRGDVSATQSTAVNLQPFGDGSKESETTREHNLLARPVSNPAVNTESPIGPVLVGIAFWFVIIFFVLVKSSQDNGQVDSRAPATQDNGQVDSRAPATQVPKARQESAQDRCARIAGASNYANLERLAQREALFDRQIEIFAGCMNGGY